MPKFKILRNMWPCLLMLEDVHRDTVYREISYVYTQNNSVRLQLGLGLV